MRLVLASTSPRRREILELLGLTFEVIAPNYEERVTAHRPIEQEVLAFSLGKARSVAENNPGALVIGSDTMIDLDGTKVGKPASLDEAHQMLRAFAGKLHRIFTGVAIVGAGADAALLVVEQVSVQMRCFDEQEIDSYLARGESLDKAGAYSIQGEGSKLIEAIQGDYLAAVGLPLRPVADYLKDCGFNLPRDIERLYREKSFRNWRNF